MPTTPGQDFSWTRTARNPRVRGRSSRSYGPGTDHYILRKELRYDIGSAMQNRVLSSLQFNGQPSLTRSTASFWTPHSARSFLPSATAALGERARNRQLHQSRSTDDHKSPKARHQGPPRLNRRPIRRSRNFQAVGRPLVLQGLLCGGQSTVFQGP